MNNNLPYFFASSNLYKNIKFTGTKNNPDEKNGLWLNTRKIFENEIKKKTGIRGEYPSDRINCIN